MNQSELYQLIEELKVELEKMDSPAHWTLAITTILSEQGNTAMKEMLDWIHSSKSQNLVKALEVACQIAENHGMKEQKFYH